MSLLDCIRTNFKRNNVLQDTKKIKILSNFAGTYLALKSLFNKVVSPTFSRTPFFTEHLRWLLLEVEIGKN